ncbi:hypothetical protein WJX77_012509 [Trebouxia sp. C0004]
MFGKAKWPSALSDMTAASGASVCVCSRWRRAVDTDHGRSTGFLQPNDQERTLGSRRWTQRGDSDAGTSGAEQTDKICIQKALQSANHNVLCERNLI